MNKIGRPRTMEELIREYGGEIKVAGKVLECTICNIKVRRDSYSLNKHVDSNKHVMVKKLLQGSPALPSLAPLENAVQ